MDLHILTVPYDSGARGAGMGAGPARILRSGFAERLTEAGHRVRVETVEAEIGAPSAEIRTAFELNRRLAARVASVVAAGWLPIILTGNCNAAVGTLAGLSPLQPAVLWLDSHGDFNTPESTTGGFLDGMALAIAAGHCWARLAAGVPGFRPTPEEHVLLVGARDFDPPEWDRLRASAVAVLPPDGVRDGLDAALDELRARTPDGYVHLDLDVLDPAEARANPLAAPGGLSADEVGSALERIGGRFRIRAVTLSAYDPACDPDGRVCELAAGWVARLLAAS